MNRFDGAHQTTRWIGPSPEDIGPWVGPEPDRPVDLQGRVAVLHLFSHREIATAHTIEGIERLSWRFHDRPLQFLGVYIGDTRSSLDDLRHHAETLVALLGPTTPTVLDPTGALAARYAAQRLPTLVVLDALGAHVGSAFGDPDWRALETTLERLIVAEAMSGTLLHGDVTGVSVKPPPSPSDEAGEGNALVLPSDCVRRPDGLVAVAETGNNRVLLGTLASGRLSVTHTVGTGAPAFFDGRIDEAALCRPRGLLFDDAGDLLVADTGNHALRKVRLDQTPPRLVTLAGTGRCGNGEERCAQELLPALTVDLRSPWSLVADDSGALTVTMGDDHRPWRYDSQRGRIYPLEDRRVVPPNDLLPTGRCDAGTTMPERALNAAQVFPLARGPEVPVRPGAGLARGEAMEESVQVPVRVGPLGTTVEIVAVVNEGRWALGSHVHVSDPQELEGDNAATLSLYLRGQLEDPEYGSLHAVDVTVVVTPERHEAASFVTQIQVALAPGQPPVVTVT